MGIVDALPEWHGTKPKLSLPGGALTLVGETKLAAASLTVKSQPPNPVPIKAVINLPIPNLPLPRN
jgi:hypothetical protein